jgi:hypothetical protein
VPAQQLFDRLGVVFSDEPRVSGHVAGGPPRVNGRNLFGRAFLGHGRGVPEHPIPRP